MLPWILFALALLVILLLTAPRLFPPPPPALPNLSQWPVVDLTHPITSVMPLWPGDPAVEIQPWATYSRDGYHLNRLTIGEHSGTHWGTPNTFIAGAASTEQVPVKRLLAAAAVIDLRQQATQDPDYRLTLSDIQAWEAAYGSVPDDGIVILWTGWQGRWRDPTGFINRDEQGIAHWPGFGSDAVEFLVNQRQVAGLGTDTHGVDPGSDDSYAASSAIYTANGIVLECLTGLEQLPAVRATLVVGGLPIGCGSGSPARVLAILPPG